LVKDRLSWRTYDVFANWKLAIIVNTRQHQACKNHDDMADGEKTKKVSIYNVRKCVLASGPRRSDYFVRLFDNNGNLSDSSRNGISRIELSELQAQAFPEFLDYTYSTGHPMAFTMENATALYSLAKYFGAKRLQNEAKQFCLQDLCHRDRCGTYYEHAKILQEETILESATKFCHDNITRIDFKSSRLLHVANPQFWLDLMKARAENNVIHTSKCQYSVISHIAVFCYKHADTLSPDIFGQLTSEQYLPMTEIHPVNAMLLLDAERRVLAGNGIGVGGDDKELSSLQLRCVNAIACGRQEDLRRLNQKWVREALKQLSPLILCEIISRGLLLSPLA
jgi:hypothetical protein